MAKVVYLTSDGTLSIIHPVDGEIETAKKSVPSGTNYEVIEDDKIPTDRTFRNAWVKGSGVVTEDVTKSKVLAHNIRREKRSEEFKPHDNIISLNIPGQDATAAETARAAIRTKYATMQTNIDNATDIAGIKTALGG
tara:strand:+ start:3121 stop:3531 length:411 start_codon:yes stop_codon:yes gene_type:complete